MPSRSASPRACSPPSRRSSAPISSWPSRFLGSPAAVSSPRSSGPFVGNPLTYPFIWYSTYAIGSYLLGNPGVRKKIDLSSGIFHASLEHLWPILKPMSVGTIPVGLGAAALSYVLVKPAVEAYQRRRQREFELRQCQGSGRRPAIKAATR